jgi:hypothetical protein
LRDLIGRILKESGRLTANPVYLVGMFTGTEKIGEGYGSSLAMAEERVINHYHSSLGMSRCNSQLLFKRIAGH